MHQPFNASFTALAGRKVSFLDAAIWIASPVAGLRPSRAGLSFTLNLPNPLSDTSSPLAAAVTIAAIRSSTAFRASALVKPWLMTSFSASSALFMMIVSKSKLSSSINAAIGETPAVHRPCRRSATGNWQASVPVSMIGISPTGEAEAKRDLADGASPKSTAHLGFRSTDMAACIQAVGQLGILKHACRRRRDPIGTAPRIGPVEQIAERAPAVCIHPAPSAMFRCVVEHVAALAECSQPIKGAVAGVVMKMRARQHHRRPSSAGE